MQDDNLWPEAETLLDLLSSLYYAQDKTVYVQDPETLIQEYTLLSEVFQWVHNEWITRSEARHETILDCQALQVQAFGDVYFGDPLRVLVEIGRDVQGKLFWSFIRHIERGGELLAPNAMEYHWLEERPTSLTLQQFIVEKCSFWSKQSQEFRQSPDYKTLLHFLECQCVAIYNQIRKADNKPPQTPRTTTNQNKSTNLPWGKESGRTKRMIKAYKQFEFELYEEFKKLSKANPNRKKSDIYREIAAGKTIPKAAKKEHETDADYVGRKCHAIVTHVDKRQAPYKVIADTQEDSIRSR